jgi:hypothetical protein
LVEKAAHHGLHGRAIQPTVTKTEFLELWWRCGNCELSKENVQFAGVSQVPKLEFAQGPVSPQGLAERMRSIVDNLAARENDGIHNVVILESGGDQAGALVVQTRVRKIQRDKGRIVVLQLLAKVFQPGRRSVSQQAGVVKGHEEAT